MCQDLSNKHKRNGCSLVEIMMAVLVFGIISAALSMPISNSMYLTTNNKTISNANNLGKTYLKDLQDTWKIQANYDQAILISTSDYTDNGKYDVVVIPSILETDDEDYTIIRRVLITIKDKNDNLLSDLYYDYNRPGGV